jgi:hypothetical protein
MGSIYDTQKSFPDSVKSVDLGKTIWKEQEEFKQA